MTRTILGLFTLSALAFSQRPTAYAYHNFSPSTTGSTIYAGSSIQGSMSGSFPPDAIRHTYTAGFTIVPPSGSGLSSVPCSVSESGDPSNSYDPQCYQSISGIAIGYYFLNLADSATCSYAGSFYTIQAHQFRRLDSAQFSIPTHQNRSRKPVESRRFLTRCAMPEHTTQKMSCTTTERVGQLCRPTGLRLKRWKQER